MHHHRRENLRGYLVRRKNIIARDKGSPLRGTAARNRNRNRNDHESRGGADFHINIPAAPARRPAAVNKEITSDSEMTASRRFPIAERSRADGVLTSPATKVGRIRVNFGNFGLTFVLMKALNNVRPPNRFPYRTLIL